MGVWDMSGTWGGTRPLLLLVLALLYEPVANLATNHGNHVARSGIVIITYGRSNTQGGTMDVPGPWLALTAHGHATQRRMGTVRAADVPFF